MVIITFSLKCIGAVAVSGDTCDISFLKKQFFHMSLYRKKIVFHRIQDSKTALHHLLEQIQNCIEVSTTGYYLRSAFFFLVTLSLNRSFLFYFSRNFCVYRNAIS